MREVSVTIAYRVLKDLVPGYTSDLASHYSLLISSTSATRASWLFLGQAWYALPQGLCTGCFSCWNSFCSHVCWANFILSFKSLLKCPLLNDTLPALLYTWQACLLPLTPNITYSALLFPFPVALTYCTTLNNPRTGSVIACLPW